MHDPTPDTSLGSFATVLAGELPGTWTSTYHPDRSGLDVVTDAVWDMNEVAEALAKHPVDHCAVLQRSDGTRLFVAEQPGHAEGYLIAALAPADAPAEAFRGVREPDGIAIDADPFSAAEHLTFDLLPRYYVAAHQVFKNTEHLTREAPTEERLVMTWSDGALVVDEPDRADITRVLTDHGFVHDTARSVLVLPGDDTARQAASVRATGERLSALGIDTVLRHPQTRPALGTTPVAPPSPSVVSPYRGR
ncbi:hypothetical protein [Streptomyces sp. SID9727]|uniref:hypothetical protein n=1 Tax=Streptomyces sp. SID9727 TaxID=2706114 RepID=UPI0013CDA3FE|nr:hypothetical protein [Streptomyces sp. SID9727]NEC66996.1 hypothetical protein [Streptomyces sp. SID9727]